MQTKYNSASTSAIRIRDTDTIVETEDAYDETEMNSLDCSDVRDAIEFDTELKATFGLAWIDEEVREPLHDALHLLHDLTKDGVATVPGTALRVLKVLLKGHPRGFGRYYSGTDPWPRASAKIQAEIDARMPDALDWLRYELKEALEQEAALAKLKKGDGSRDKSTINSAGDHPSDGDIDVDFAAKLYSHPESGEDRFASKPRYLPVEADSERRRKIEADAMIDPEHLGTLSELKLLLTSDQEKTRVFCGTLGQEARVILNDLLATAIGEIEVEHATVVGIVNVMIVRMLDICGALQLKDLGRLLLRS
jgi:hypothetical protein